MKPAFLLAACCLLANAADVDVSEAWVKATLPGQPVAGAYFKIRAQRQATLVGVETSAAGLAELHEMKMDGGVMKMRALNDLALPAGQTLTLQPGGLHIMLMDLKQVLRAGDRVPLKLTVSSAGKTEVLRVDAQVR